MFSRHLFRTRRLATCAMLAVMPLGAELTAEQPGQLSLGVHGGSGQVVSVMRGCDGEVLRTSENPFAEVAGEVEYRRRMSDDAALALGFRGGSVHLDWHPFDDYGGAPGDLEFYYLNPSIALETTQVGIGFGYLDTDLPNQFGNYVPADAVPVSAHLRVGRASATYFLFSMNESAPLLTGGGPYVLGFGYHPVLRLGGFTGVSAGFYDGIGIAQRFEFAAGDHLRLDIAARIASVEGHVDGGISAGVRVLIPTP